MTARLILARHGETTANAGRMLSGHNDVALTERGRLQAGSLTRRLATEPITAAYASDLSRARETAEIALGERALPVQIDPRLRELNFGEWEGKRFDEIRRDWPDAFARLLAITDSFCAPGGEPILASCTRIATAIEEIAARHNGETVLVVAHGGTIQIALAHALAMPIESLFRLATGNCGVSVIEFHRGGPQVTLVNDCAHTAPAER